MKTILIAMLFVFLSPLVHSQHRPAPYYGFRLGLTAHPTFGMISAEEGTSRGTSLGFSYGLMADFNFAAHYSFNTGLTITTINGKSTEINATPYHIMAASTSAIAYDLKYKMQYIEIPMVVKLKTSKIGALKWFGQFGLSNDFKLRARQNAETSNLVIADDVNSSDWTKFYRAGLIIGVGGEFDLDEHTSLMGGISYNNGLTNIANAKNTVRNHFVSLNIGVFF